MDAPLRSLCAAWLEKIRAGVQAKQPYTEVADQCMRFFTGSVGFMFKKDYWHKYISRDVDPPAPLFHITLNKAFELVATFGPVLYDRNPVRTVKPYASVDLPPEVFDVPEQYMAAMQQEQQIRKLVEARCKLLEAYLSYTPREQPDGGLRAAAEAAITEALVKGGGILWPDVITFPSGKRITGCLYGSWDDLIVDPDARTFNYGDALWIAQRCIEPKWIVARKYGIPESELKGTIHSREAAALIESSKKLQMEKAKGRTHDLVVYWKIWSCCGVGTRLSGGPHKVAEEYGQAFDEVVGDNAYIVVAPGYPHPLNCPRGVFEQATDEEIRQRFSWPTPYWLDRRWPCVKLEFYPIPDKPWALAPLAPGLGELTFMNIMVGNLASRIYASSQDIIAVVSSAAAEVEDRLKSHDWRVVLRIPDIHKSIQDVVSYIQQPPVNFDAWRILDAVAAIFDKRTGLTDLLYGLNPGGAASRSASDIMVKREALSVRPEHMSKCVAQWLTDAAEMEKMCLHFHRISGQDVSGLFGPAGAYAWEKVVLGASLDEVLHQVRCQVEASSVRRPNKDRDVANIGQIYQPLSQLYAAYAQTTGDTRPINHLNKLLLESMDQPWEGMEIGPWLPLPLRMQMAQQQGAHAPPETPPAG